MNVLKKTGAFALVLMLAVCFCAVAGAEELGTTTTTTTNNEGITSLTFTSTLTEGVHLAGDVTYAIDTGAALVPSTGTAPAVTFTSSGTVSVSAGTASTTANVALTLDATSATNGIFEYTITQTLPNVFRAGTNPETLYLTVVVANNAVTQAVLHTTSGGTDHYTVNGNKVAGFEYNPVYTTGGDVTLQKVVDGLYGGLNAGNFKFIIYIYTNNYANLPFTVSSSGTLSTYTDGIANSTGTIASGELASRLDASGIAKFGVTLSGTTTGGDTLTISGLPQYATVTITEDDTTANTTTATLTDGQAQPTNLTLVDKAGVVEVKAAGSTEAVVFTNTYTSISMTGVSLRYAPYLLTLGAGLVVLPATKSYRRREDV